jgi:O-6-methylguanine DNA methyltransferase
MTVSDTPRTHSVDFTVYIAAVDDTPLSPVWVAMSERGLVAVEIQGSQEDFTRQLERWGYSPVVLDEVRLAGIVQQFQEYLAGQRRSFEIPIDWTRVGSFQQSALRATLAIPYGETRTYSQIASQINRMGAARAVGRAEATNPVPLVIPCHRVLGKDGKLHGYGAPGGIKTKAWLLALEHPRED